MKPRAAHLRPPCQQRGDNHPLLVGAVACVAQPSSVMLPPSGFSPAHVIFVVFATPDGLQAAEIAQLNFRLVSRCLIPDFDGASSAQAWKDALWDRFCTAAPARQRQSVERYNIVKPVLSLSKGEPEDAGEASRHQPEDRREMEETHGGQGPADGAEGSALDGADHRG